MPCLSSSVTTARIRALTTVTLVTTIGAAALGAAPLGAQQPANLAASDTAATSAPVVLRTEAAPAGPTRDGAAVAAQVHRAARQPTTADARAALAPASHPHAGPAVALMLVGATALVIGLAVGGDAQTPLVVGGAFVGLIGLYQYLL
jgi:hypothetical protein